MSYSDAAVGDNSNYSTDETTASQTEPSYVFRPSGEFTTLKFTLPVHGDTAQFTGDLVSSSYSASSSAPFASIPEPRERQKFTYLKDGWQKDTLYSSSTTDMVSHLAYLEIIGMGDRAVPLILEDLMDEVEHWFTALRAITGEDPVPDDSKGNLREMRECWLDWGRAKGHI